MTAHSQKKILHSVKWSYIGISLQRVLEPLLILVLAKFLLPEDFGIMAIAAAIVAFGRQLQSLGLSAALIQAEEDVDDLCDAVFWLNLAGGLLLFIMLQWLAPSLSLFFKDERLVGVTRLLSFIFVIFPFDSVQEAILQREFAFKRLIKRRLFPLLAQAVVSISLALLGFSYWSLVWGVLVRSVMGVLTLWRISPWRPRFRFRWQIIKKKLGFGLMVTLGTLQGWMIIQGDRLFAGRAFSLAGLGAYDFGVNLVQLVGILLCEPVFRVAYVTFSRQQKDEHGIIKTYHDFVYGLSLMTLPAMVGLALSAPIAMPLLFKSKWNASIPVIGILALTSGLAKILYLNSYLYKALNRPDIEPKFNLVKMAYLLPAYLIGMKLSLTGFAVLRGSIAIVLWLPELLIARSVLGKPRGFFWPFFLRPLGASVIMGGVVLLFRVVLAPHFPPILLLVAILAAGIVVYSAVILVIDPRALRIFRQALVYVKSNPLDR